MTLSIFEKDDLLSELALRNVDLLAGICRAAFAEAD